MIAQGVAVLLLLAPAPTGTFQRVSVGGPFSGGADQHSGWLGGSARSVSISADGRWVAFSSYATNLVTGDTNDERDVFVRDTLLRRTVRVSVGAGGVQGDRESSEPSISRDGRRVVFSSISSLTPGDTGGTSDVFVRDLHTGTTSRVSDGGWNVAPDISADGRHVAFSDGSAVLVRDLVTGAVEKIPAAVPGFAQSPSISADGRRVAYRSPSPVNSANAIFLYDRPSGTSTEVSRGVSTDRSDLDDHVNPEVSANGRHVVYAAGGYVRQYDAVARTRRTVAAVDAGQLRFDQSSDGRYVVVNTMARLVASDRDPLRDTYRWDRNTGGLLRVTTGQVTEVQGSYTASISASGNRIAFDSDAHAGLAPGTDLSYMHQVYLWSAP